MPLETASILFVLFCILKPRTFSGQEPREHKTEMGLLISALLFDLVCSFTKSAFHCLYLLTVCVCTHFRGDLGNPPWLPNAHRTNFKLSLGGKVLQDLYGGLLPACSPTHLTFCCLEPECSAFSEELPFCGSPSALPFRLSTVRNRPLFQSPS